MFVLFFFWFRSVFRRAAFELIGNLFQIFLGLANQAERSALRVRRFPLRSSRLLFEFQLLEFFFQRASFRDDVFFELPFRLERVRFLANFGEFLFYEGEALAGAAIVLLFQRLLFDFELGGGIDVAFLPDRQQYSFGLF